MFSQQNSGGAAAQQDEKSHTSPLAAQGTFKPATAGEKLEPMVFPALDAEKVARIKQEIVDLKTNGVKNPVDREIIHLKQQGKAIEQAYQESYVSITQKHQKKSLPNCMSKESIILLMDELSQLEDDKVKKLEPVKKQLSSLQNPRYWARLKVRSLYRISQQVINTTILRLKQQSEAIEHAYQEAYVDITQKHQKRSLPNCMRKGSIILLMGELSQLADERVKKLEPVKKQLSSLQDPRHRARLIAQKEKELQKCFFQEDKQLQAAVKKTFPDYEPNIPCLVNLEKRTVVFIFQQKKDMITKNPQTNEYDRSPTARVAQDDIQSFFGRHLKKFTILCPEQSSDYRSTEHYKLPLKKVDLCKEEPHYLVEFELSERDQLLEALKGSVNHSLRASDYGFK